MSPLHKDKFDFSNLFVLDMANNHQGSLSHGLNIIKEHSAVSREEGVRSAIKFQFRDLDTFIHPRQKKNKENKHIQRFLSTRLGESEYKKLVTQVKKEGLISMCTPFDEASVDLIKKLGIDVVKIASCSATDWPLIEKAVTLGKPMIVSTGGLSIKDIDKIVSFLDHRYAHFALMHCVSIYPTPIDKLGLNQIEILKKRYPNVVIGFSTHEDPNNTEAVQIAYAKGARMFERHIGIETSSIKLNSYSSTPKQLAPWIQSYKRAALSCGVDDEMERDSQEIADLSSLMRGVYVKKDVKKGKKLATNDVFFAIPLQDGQLTSGQFKEGMVADKNYKKETALSSILANGKPLFKHAIYQTIHAVKGMLNEARIPMNHEYGVELSHHYGIENFNETGVIIIDCINREYCKKILVCLPGQSHPYHHHMKKEEAFHVLSGVIELELDGKRKTLYPGDVQVVSRGVKHRFWSEKGGIFEEVSTTHHNNDSIYEDPEINEMPRELRKTKLINWGRHQFE